MKLEKLISVLAKQEKNLENLYRICIEKKETLVENNHEKLKVVISEEERALLSIQLSEEKRLQIMQNLFSEFNIDNERFKIQILVDSLKGKVSQNVINEISKSEERIKNYINEITRINHLNMVLIQHSRNLIHETIQTIISSSNHSILDRKG